MQLHRKTETKSKSPVTKKAKPEFVYHLVQKGDTLWNIAQRYEGATVEQIMKINSITNKNSLKPGTRLKLNLMGDINCYDN
jgi:LysM repeat protein